MKTLHRQIVSVFTCAALSLWLTAPTFAIELNGGNNNNGNNGGLSQTAPPPTQQQTVNKAQQVAQNGSNASNSAGAAAMAAGAAMMAAGAAMMSFPPTMPAGMALLAAGAALLMAGQQGMNAGSKAGDMAGQLGTTSTNLDAVTQKVDGGTDTTGGSGIKVDPNLLRTNPKIAKILDDLEKNTGYTGDAFAKALNDGASAKDLLMNAPKKLGVSEAQIDKALAAGAANGMSGNEMLDKLGLTPDELLAMHSGDLNLNGGAAKTGAAKDPMAAFDSMFGDKNKDGAVGPDGKLKKGLSPELQAALDRNGITGRTVFDMVKSQYKKKTPVLFGVINERRPASVKNANPFANLTGSGMEL